MPLTTKDLNQRAINAIERREDCALEIAFAHGQMFDNVKHMTWFIAAVSVWFTVNVKRWSKVVIDI